MVGGGGGGGGGGRGVEGGSMRPGMVYRAPMVCVCRLWLF